MIDDDATKTSNANNRCIISTYTWTFSLTIFIPIFDFFHQTPEQDQQYPYVDTTIDQTQKLTFGKSVKSKLVH